MTGVSTYVGAKTIEPKWGLFRDASKHLFQLFETSSVAVTSPRISPPSFLVCAGLFDWLLLFLPHPFRISSAPYSCHYAEEAAARAFVCFHKLSLLIEGKRPR
jgi:hypothetical protein